MKKRLLSLLVIFAALIAFIPETCADSDKITLIVEVNGDAALETAEAVLMGASEYNETDAAASYTYQLMSVQEKVQSDIKSRVDNNAEAGYTYTNVFNGFSVTVDKADIDKIKNIPNVENVYVAGSHRYIEPAEEEDISPFSDDGEESLFDNCCQMMNVPYMHELGYKGQGQAIAVIDSELDVNHEFFSSPIESPKYSKADIADLISEKNLNVSVSANRVWRSDKIPFAYSYGNNNADVYSTFLVHGSHVCGIAAGKNGSRKDGTTFSGVAPEAQIIFMGILRDSENLPDDAIIAAIDDASKMDIAAINMSLGADFAFQNSDLGSLFETVISAAVNAGIEVCVAAGNAGGLFPAPDAVDSSASGLPAVISGATSVAAAYGSTGKICSFSSWGTNTSLELKPEITAPGGSIYSSVPDDKYAVYSGTSMAAPHMTGAAALMRQYIEENYQSDNPAGFIENLIMTGAQKIWKNESEQILYSPRNQGAGLIDLKAAATTPVILLGADGKTKISLKDKLTDTFQIEFTAENLTDTDVNYDTVELFLMTDSYAYNSTYGNVVSGLKNLSFTSSDMPESITVPANSEKEISFTVQLDSEETAENLEVFTNGFYIDGFVELSDSADTVPVISIPYTGFYGDWTDAPAFDKPYYQGGRLKETFLGSESDKCVCSNITLLRCAALGKNQILETLIADKTVKKTDVADYDEYESESYAGISPNGDGDFDFLCVGVVPERPVENCAVRIENSAGEIMDVRAEANTNDEFGVLKIDGEEINAPSDKYDKYLINCTEYNDLRSLPDGDYTVYVSGNLPYDGANCEEISMKFYVDTSAPEITYKEIREENGKTYLDLSISDNRYVMGVIAEGENADGTVFEQAAYTKAVKTGDVSMDITGADISTLEITALDYAYNKYECKAAGDITAAMPQKPVLNENSIDMSFDISNKTFKTVTADIIAAVYDEYGVLKAVSFKRNEVIPEGESTQRFNFESGLAGKTVKVMIFNSVENMKPLGLGEVFSLD